MEKVSWDVESSEFGSHGNLIWNHLGTYDEEPFAREIVDVLSSYAANREQKEGDSATGVYRIIKVVTVRTMILEK